MLRHNTGVLRLYHKYRCDETAFWNTCCAAVWQYQCRVPIPLPQVSPVLVTWPVSATCSRPVVSQNPRFVVFWQMFPCYLCPICDKQQLAAMVTHAHTHTRTRFGTHIRTHTHRQTHAVHARARAQIHRRPYTHTQVARSSINEY